MSIPSIMLIFVASCITQCLSGTEHAEFPVYRWSYQHCGLLMLPDVLRKFLIFCWLNPCPNSELIFSFPCLLQVELLAIISQCSLYIVGQIVEELSLPVLAETPSISVLWNGCLVSDKAVNCMTGCHPHKSVNSIPNRSVCRYLVKSLPSLTLGCRGLDLIWRTLLGSGLWFLARRTDRLPKLLSIEMDHPRAAQGKKRLSLQGVG